MNFSHLTPAGDTAAILQEAARAGSDVMIPGAFERRASRPAVPSPVAPAAVMSDWQRLEYEREGGGAPIERRSSRRRRLLSRLWRWVLYPSDPPAIVHPLPAQW
jgi:hypothetical protein